MSWHTDWEDVIGRKHQDKISALVTRLIIIKGESKNAGEQ